MDLPSANIGLHQVQYLHPNKNNINKNNITTTTKKENVVDFMNTKDKREEKMLRIRGRMREFDFLFPYLLIVSFIIQNK